MNEAYVRLLCPSCQKTWGENPNDLPPSTESFTCRSCGSEHSTAEFMRTERDLEILKRFHEEMQ